MFSEHNVKLTDLAVFPLKVALWKHLSVVKEVLSKHSVLCSIFRACHHKKRYSVLPIMHCFQWDILYRRSCLAIVMERTLFTEFISVLHFRHVSSLSLHKTTSTKYPIWCSALWEVLWSMFDHYSPFDHLYIITYLKQCIVGGTPYLLFSIVDCPFHCCLL